MSNLRCAVIGVGYLGKFHAQKYAALDGAQLVAVADASEENAKAIAAEHGAEYTTDYRELLGKVDAVSIVVPTQLHHEVAKAFLEKGCHVLVEKPITVTVEQAEELIQIAKKNNAVLQVGHLERFNSAMLALDNVLKVPKFIESHRLASFNPRGADVSVILDLMIHDIDLILNIVKSPVKSIQTNGLPVLSSDIDIANARIQFENGCVANVTASRASNKAERKMRIFQEEVYISVDFQDKKLAIHRKGDKEMFPGIPEIISEESVYEQSDALLAEITAFIDSIVNGTPPAVSGEDGKQALETAIQISEILSSNK